MLTTTTDASGNWRRAGVLAASFCLPLGCAKDEPGDPDLGTDTGDGDPTMGDGDGDPMTGDGDGDPTMGDGDGDPMTGDGDGDPGDGDGDPATGDCGPYPAGPYKWYDDNVVPPDSTFPAMYGPDGQEVTLSMADVHDNCEEVKALAFVFGAND